MSSFPLPLLEYALLPLLLYTTISIRDFVKKLLTGIKEQTIHKQTSKMEIKFPEAKAKWFKEEIYEIP